MHILSERRWVGRKWRKSPLEVQVMVSMFILQLGNTLASWTRR